MKVYIEWTQSSIRLEQGETLIGRGLACDVRFNDPAISREHARITVTPSGAVLENLSSTNPTRRNGTPIKAEVELQNGDVLHLGYRVLQVRMADQPDAVSEAVTEEATISRVESWSDEDTPRRSLTPDGVPLGQQPEGRHQAEREESVRQAADALEAAAQRSADQRSAAQPSAARRQIPTPVQGMQAVPLTAIDTIDDLALPNLAVQNCRRCGAPLVPEDQTCPDCGAKVSAARPLCVTQQIKLSDLERRREPRHEVDFPVLYHSETLTFEAAARDLSRGGVYISSELLDPPGTECELTLLPDGAPPLSTVGTVAHVITAETGEGGRPPGMGVKFTKLPAATKRWILNLVDRLAQRNQPTV